MSKVLLAIPTTGAIDAITSAAASRLALQGSAADYITAKGRPVDHVRNGLIMQFLAGDWTHLFLLDSDVGPPLDCLSRLLALARPLASGCYPVIQQGVLKWAISNKNSDGHYRLLEDPSLPTGPFEADAGGAGCLLISRAVFDRVKWPWFKWVENPDGSQISEDIYFFDKCAEAGIRVTIEPDIICDHFKDVNITALMRLKMNKKGAL